MRHGVLLLSAVVVTAGVGCNEDICWEPQFVSENDEADWQEAMETAECFVGNDCEQGEVCASHEECVPVVAGCPLTDECLQDPTLYVPDWRGVDPWYAGDIAGQGIMGRIEVELDFHDDHIYGEGLIFTWNQSLEFSWYEENELRVTGSRDEDGVLWGQLIDVNDGYRFDAVFDATMPSSSEIIGDVTIASDAGVVEAVLHLQRLSPCGCDTNDGSSGTEEPATLN